MKKFLFLIALFTLLGGANSYATKLYADLSSNVGTENESNGWWIASSHTLGWKLSYANSFALSGFSGDLSSYETITINASGYSGGNEYRLIFYGPNFDGGQKILGAFYSNGGTYNLKDRGFTKEMLSNITSINLAGASENGSIVIERIYLEKPTEFKFNDAGKAYLYPSDLSATSWGLDSYDSETGIVTKSTEGYGSIFFDFGELGYDFSNITNIEISIDGEYDDIRDYSYVTDLNGHTQYLGATGGSYSLGGDIDSNIKTWNIGLNTKMGSMKINYICFTSNVLKARLGEEVEMSTLKSYHWNSGTSEFEPTGYTPNYRINESTGTAYFGVDFNGENCQNYTDVESYKAIRIYSAKGNVPRAMFFNSTATGQQQFNFEWNDKGFYELQLSGVYSSVSNYKLISVRPQQYTSSSINGIYMVANNAVNNYSISGSGIITESVTAALADATATSYDATGVTGTGVDLTSVANPNALFKANAGVLANTKNVIVDGTCANLVLEDGKPFKAPADFTATSASYTTTINAGAQAGTLCLPFAAAIPEGVSAYTLTYSSGDKAKATAVEATIPANTPVLLNGSGEKTFTGASVDIDADAENVSGSLTGVFASQSVPTGSYVLQKQGENVGFYRVDAEDPITIKPFRAYLTAAASARSISITYDGITGINDVKVNKVGEKDVYYNLNGQRVSNPTKGIFIKNGVKVYFE